MQDDRQASVTEALAVAKNFASVLREEGLPDWSRRFEAIVQALEQGNIREAIQQFDATSYIGPGSLSDIFAKDEATFYAAWGACSKSLHSIKRLLETIRQKIEWSLSTLSESPYPWRDSVVAQLKYCKSVLAGTEDPARLEQLNMGYIAVRELDGLEPNELGIVLSEIQYDMQQSYLPYAAKVRLGIHRRT